MPIGLCRLHLHLPGCASLKEKRSRLKPLLERLRREFNVAVAETDFNDVWQSAEVSVVTVANEAARAETQLQTVAEWIDTHWPDVMVEQTAFEWR